MGFSKAESEAKPVPESARAQAEREAAEQKRQAQEKMARIQAERRDAEREADRERIRVSQNSEMGETNSIISMQCVHTVYMMISDDSKCILILR
jgi:hypothetical protein